MLRLNFNPFPHIETKQLVLREISMQDAEDLFLLRTNKDAMKYIDKPLEKSIDDVKALIQKIRADIDANAAIAWGISLKEQNGLLGTIGYHYIVKEHYRAEIGYMLHPLYWRRGIMSEAIAQILHFGFKKMQLHSIEANVNPSNAMSIKLLEKFDFCKEAHFKENYFFEGKFLDSAIYSLIKP